MYEKLDALIVENIARLGEASLTQVSGRGAHDEAKRIANLTRREEFRVIDARLQALRKRGLIRHVGGSWRVITAATTP